MSDQNFKTETEIDTTLPVLVVRQDVFFPNMTGSLPIGRPESKAAINAALERHNGKIIIVTQKDADQEELTEENLYKTGVLVQILDTPNELPDGSIQLHIDTEERVTLDSISFENGYIAATNTITPFEDDATELEASANFAKDGLLKYVARKDKVSEEAKTAIYNATNAAEITALILTELKLEDMGTNDRQKLLESDSAATVLQQLGGVLQGKNAVADLEKKIATRVKSQMAKTQREYYLREQQKAIQQELGEGDEQAATELEELAKHFEDENIPVAVREKASKELKRLKSMSPGGAEYNVLRTYMDVLRDIPWGIRSEVNEDLKAARAALEEDHYGLDQVKENVVKHLAVQKRLKAKGIEDVGAAKIMCMVGPPGVGKTSIAQSLSKSTGRKYVRLALGGVRDEAELRGHRRTYIGAKPGKIVSHLIKAGTMNPLFVLDEIDKMGSDQRGDPASAMLEILDPEQNNSFEDHYLDLEMDISDVMFYCTANEYGNIPGPLQDRMEVTFLGSYMPEEKLEIAKQHLVRKQMKATGLEADEFSIDDEALEKVISAYTQEAGVRNLKRIIGQICVEAVVKLDEEGVTSVHVTENMLEDLLGPEQFEGYQTKAEHTVGTVAGLAYTAVGGKPLFIETVQFPSKNEAVKITGNLQDVMKESIDYALSYLKAHTKDLGLEESSFKDKTIHVHCPAGAVPKDGPSAGAAMLTAIFSQVTGKPVNREVAMTGEINLSGQVTAIGGLKEKLTGAANAGFKKVLIPKDNVKDLHDVPEQVKAALEIVPVDKVDQVLKHAIVGYKPTIMTLGS